MSVKLGTASRDYDTGNLGSEDAGWEAVMIEAVQLFRLEQLDSAGTEYV
jgi:hypothetical protein